MSCNQAVYCPPIDGGPSLLGNLDSVNNFGTIQAKCAACKCLVTSGNSRRTVRDVRNERRQNGRKKDVMIDGGLKKSELRNFVTSIFGLVALGHHVQSPILQSRASLSRTIDTFSSPVTRKECIRKTRKVRRVTPQNYIVMLSKLRNIYYI